MHTNSGKRVGTCPVSIAAVPATALGLLGDGARLPDWGPGVAYGRVVPNASGSEFPFALPFPDDTDHAALDVQITKGEAELETVQALCEAR